MPALRVLVIAQWVPHPEMGHAGGLLVLEHTRDLASLATVSLLAPSSDGVTEVDGVEVVPIPVTAPQHGLARRWRYVRWLVRGLGPGPQELHAARRFLRSAAGQRLVAAADVVEIQSEDMLPLVDDVAAGPRVVLWAHDVVSEDLFAAQDSLRSRRRRLESRVRLFGTLRAERRLLPRCHGAVVFKAADEHALRTLGFTGPVHVASPPIPASGQPPAHRELALQPTVVIVAAFDRPVNLEGLTWFLDDVWPRVRAQVPHARVVVAGAHAPDADVAGVQVVGFVPDLSTVYADADVAIVPARGGAGLKFTVAQALMNAVPVVSTTSGARGYPSPDDADYLIRRDEADTFAAAVVAILRLPDRGRAAGESGREWWRVEDRSRCGVGALVEWYAELVQHGRADG